MGNRGRGVGWGGGRGNRWTSFVLVAVLHIVAVLGLIAAFTPRLGQQAVSVTLAAFDVALPPPPPLPPPPIPARAPRPAGAAAPRATPAPIAAPPPRIMMAPLDVPPVASTGTAASSGAAAAGQGSGAGGTGNGAGGGGGTRLVQIGGTIDSARDYPIETRDRRIGTSVTIVFTVGTDGRAHDCRVRDPSGDPRSDAITCRLAEQRFRFRPATDAAGNPVPALHGWRQSWHY